MTAETGRGLSHKTARIFVLSGCSTRQRTHVRTCSSSGRLGGRPSSLSAGGGFLRGGSYTNTWASSVPRQIVVQAGSIIVSPSNFKSHLHRHHHHPFCFLFHLVLSFGARCYRVVTTALWTDVFLTHASQRESFVNGDSSLFHKNLKKR